jgi:hypothetical protein
LFIAPFLAACASGPRLILGQPIKKEVAVLLRVSTTGTAGDQFGGIAAIAETVTEGLKKRGIANQLYSAADDHPGTPRIEIWVTHWSAGNAGLSEAGRVVGGLVGAAIQGAGEGTYKVIVKIYREGDAEPVCVREHSGGFNPDDAAEDVSTGEDLGSTILSDSLRETATCSTDAD